MGRFRGLRVVAALLFFIPLTQAQSALERRAQEILSDLVRLKAVNPPGGETRTARYLEQLAKRHGIACEVLGADAERMNFVARLPGTGAKRPLLLMAHSDVVPVEAAQWTMPPFDAVVRNGAMYGRGTEDTLGLLAAEMATLIELKRSGAALSRDVIVLSEADEESGSTGIKWMLDHAWDKIDAEFALNEGGTARRVDGVTLFSIQTSEKIPTRAILRATGTAGHASLPRVDNPVVHLARAIVKITEAEQPIRMNTTVRRFFEVVSETPNGAGLKPILAALDAPSTAIKAVQQLRTFAPELAAMLQTTVTPTMLNAGVKINVIPNTAEASIDIRRLPEESAEEVYARLRAIINDPAVAVVSDNAVTMPATEPSSTTSDLYKAMEKVFRAAGERVYIAPFQLRGATDGSYLRARGMAVYGVPLFEESGRAHANDERIALRSLYQGTTMLEQIVREVAQ